MSDTQRKPWLKFYPSDWLGDERLRLCSLAARGLWADMICLMHKSDPYGHMLVNGLAPTTKQLARMLGTGQQEVHALLKELGDAGVYSQTEFDVIYSRRMVRDGERQAKLHEQGKLGGNPNLIRGAKRKDRPPDKPALNPEVQTPLKAHIPEARYSEANASDGAAVRPMTVYDTGEALLSQDGTKPASARALIAKLCKANGDDAVAAAIEDIRSRDPPPAEMKSALIAAVANRGKPNGKHRNAMAEGFDIVDRIIAERG